MKKLFIFLNILLGACVCWLAYTHVSYKPAPTDKILNMTPDGANIKKTGIFDRENITPPAELSYIYENNVFVPNRGVVESENGDEGEGGGPSIIAKKIYRGNFELTGICRMPNTQGAVITATGSRRSKALRAKFYRVNEEIGDTGYKLIEISPGTGSVVLDNGSNQTVIELDRNDRGSSKRRDTEVKRQELVAKQAEINLRKNIGPGVSPNSKVQGPGVGSKPVVGPTPATNKKPTAKEIAEIRKKILERMTAAKKNKKKSNNRK